MPLSFGFSILPRDARTAFTNIHAAFAAAKLLQRPYAEWPSEFDLARMGPLG